MATTLTDYLANYQAKESLIAELGYPEIPKNGAFAATRKLSTLSLSLYEGDYIMRRVWDDIDRDLLPVIMGALTRHEYMTFKLERQQWENPANNTLVFAAHIFMQVSHTQEVGVPNWGAVMDLAISAPENHGVVYFCDYCETPYYYGEKKCSSCGSSLTFTKRKRRR